MQIAEKVAKREMLTSEEINQLIENTNKKLDQIFEMFELLKEIATKEKPEEVIKIIENAKESKHE